MQLLYKVVWLGTTSTRRYERIAEVGSVAIEAAAAAISAEEYNLALEWLEAGRASNSSPIGTNTVASELATLQHHRLVSQYNALISQVRDVPGFEDYMHTKKLVDLIPAVRSGPVVVVNVHEMRRCRAPEEDATITIVEIAQDRKPHVRSRGHRDHFEQVLTALWYNFVEPVLEHLEYTKKLPVDQLTHITWCTTGALSFLPIHAAGNYGLGEEHIYDYAITSYTPTLSALLPTASPSHGAEFGVLVVSQESTAGLPALPGTKHELAAIQKHFGCLPHSQLEKSQATPAAVLAAMEKHECTAMGDEKMPDKAIHLAAGMLVAGYPSVIATMWSIGDYDAPVVADHVYGQLIGGGQIDWRRAARALHTAVGVLREKVGEKEYTRWVPYVHIGA
ncbi:hypothetical protein BDV93DRAFT_512022 [Ceratobasidium sp. AG-I]|nr:hypothetical protein BDV93DRAFT_512022 [Ceratobasidium sp. AG-I]